MISTPAGTRLLRYAELGSTNAEAMRLAASGEPGPAWIVADMQTAGKGRSGRAWASEPGNLFASYLFDTTAPISAAHQLSLVAGVAAFDAIASFGLTASEGLRLKWPNDILIGDAKAGGILVESTSLPARQTLTVVIGVGLNLQHHPDIAGRHVTSLSRHGVAVTTGAALDALDAALLHATALWDAAHGFSAVRAAWLARSGPVGQRISVNGADGTITGTFAGLDSDGALIIELQGGESRRCTYGDVTIEN